MKPKKIFLFTAIFSLIAASASIVAFTYAAYLNLHDYELPIDINTTAISGYFTNGGAGTLANPYKISNSADLRTLQQLNVVGVFSKATYFQMTADITYSGAALLPIGNEDYPFYSQFDGNGYTITGLVVNGANTNDIGMFGYVAMGAVIKNMILTTPTINVVASTTGPTAHAATGNLMDPILSTAGINIGDLTFTNATPARFTVPRTTVTGTDSAVYNIVYQSSDTALLYSSGTNQWTCGIPNSANPTSLYPVQLVARAFALYNNMVISYTLERWQVNVKGDGTVEPGSASVNPGYFKTVHRATMPHETYVGFFIGHLDGNASYLGMFGSNASGAANGKITINGRNARSYSCLVGRDRGADGLDDSAVAFDQKYMDFNKVIPQKSLDGLSYSVDETPAADFFTNQNTNAVNDTKTYGFTATDATYFRFYPGFSNTHFSYTNPSDNTTSTLYAQKWTAPLGTAVESDRKTWIIFQYWYNKIFSVKNGFWFWLNAPTGTQTSGVYESTTFEVKIRIDYIATSASTSNYFQILTNAYNPNATGTLGQTPSYVSATHWVNLDSAVYTASAHPVVSTVAGGGTTSGKLVSTTLSFIVDRTSTFWEGLFTNGTYYPMLAVGVGKGTTATQTDTLAATTIHYYYDNFTADAFTLNIIKLSVVFTSKDGNVSEQVGNVDYLYKTPTRSTDFSGGTYIAWNNSSNVKIQFNVSDYTQNGSGTIFSYYRNYSTNLMNIAVNCLYTSSTHFPPTNTDTYEAAVLTGV